MFETSQIHSQLSEDTALFLETLNRLTEHPRSDVRAFFDPKETVVVARAPGRLDVMGGIADYSGSMVLELPIREATFVALQPDPIRTVSIITLSEQAGRESLFEMPLGQLEGNGQPLKYESAR